MQKGVVFSFLFVTPTSSQASLGQRTQVHQLLAVRAPHPLVLEGPQGTLEALLIVTRHRHPTEAQALAYLHNMCDISNANAERDQESRQSCI